jgi:hypothetical protein
MKTRDVACASLESSTCAPLKAAIEEEWGWGGGGGAEDRAVVLQTKPNGDGHAPCLMTHECEAILHQDKRFIKFHRGALANTAGAQVPVAENDLGRRQRVKVCCKAVGS